MPDILFVEDDNIIASGLVYALGEEGYNADHYTLISDAKKSIKKKKYDLAILDLTLPDGDGYELCGILKRGDVPVIFLTAVDDEANAVKGLEMGADDYITKPFRLKELMARIKVVLRRGNDKGNQNIININDDIKINTMQAKVIIGEEEIELTALEYKLLLVFACNKGRTLSRSQLLSGIWDVEGDFVNDNTLTVYIKRLREKLGDDKNDPKIIKTVRGMGYKMDEHDI